MNILQYVLELLQEAYTYYIDILRYLFIFISCNTDSNIPDARLLCNILNINLKYICVYSFNKSLEDKLTIEIKQMRAAIPLTLAKTPLIRI